MIGQIIDDRYRVEAVVGKGAMGTVYRANDYIEHRPVALKTLHFFDQPTDNAISRFNREFRVLTQLDHPGVVRAYGHGRYQNVPYLVMELLQGQTLKEFLANQPLSQDRLIELTQQICAALSHLHSQSIVHRDLKPGNIMILSYADGAQETLQVKLMDFGLVRVTDLSSQLTQEGMTLGTVAYIAPEQAQGFSVDFRADLYSLGAILYEMATGRPPFVNDNPVTILMHQITASPLPPRHFRPDLDEGLNQLILQLLAKDPGQRPPNAAAVAAHLTHLNDGSAPTLASPAQRADLIPRLPLIGRQAALDQLTEYWIQARTGQGQVVLLSGVAGSGKTRLITEIGQQVQTYGAKFVHGNCREQAALPYQPFVDLLDKMIDKMPPAEREMIPPDLLRLIPRFASSLSDSTVSDPAEARLRLFGAFWGILHQHSQECPAMFVIEDVQWADPSTLDLLGYLAERVDQVPVLFCLTYRPEEIDHNPALKRLLGSLERQQNLCSISLEALTLPQVAQLLQAALGQEKISDWVIDHFYQATDGNPLFIEETLKALAAEGHVSRWMDMDTSQWTTMQSMTLQLPKSVLSLAERRLQILSTEDRTLLTAAAILGPEFSFTLLQEVTHSDEDTLLDTIDRLLIAQLINELPLKEGEDRYRFTQESLRQALLNTASQRRLRVMHRRAGEAIGKLYDTSRPQYWPALAYHYAQSGHPEKALKYFTLAGDAAARVYASAEAIAHYTDALSLIKATSTADPLGDTEQLLHLYTRRGRHLELSGLYHEALENYQDMEALALERQDQPLQLAALTARATLRTTLSPVYDVQEGQAILDQAITLARALGDCPTEAKILWSSMHLYMNTGQHQKARTYGEESIAIARELNLREQLAFSLNDISGLYLIEGQVDQAKSVSQEARTLWRELNNKPMLADNLTREALFQYFNGNFEETLQLIAAGSQISQEIGNLWGQAFGNWIRGYVWLEYGQIDKAIANMQEAIDWSTQAGMAGIQVSARGHLAWLYAHLGDLDRALELAQLAQAKSEEFFPGWQHETGAILTRLHLLNGDLEAAASALKQIETNIDQKSLNSFSSFFVPVAKAEFALAHQDYAGAIALLDDYIALIHKTQTRTFLSEALCIKGQVLMVQGQLDEAHAALTEAHQAAERINSRRSLGPILLKLTQLETQRGNPTQAETHRQQAQNLIDYITDQISDLSLRAKFLQLPYIQGVLAGEEVGRDE